MIHFVSFSCVCKEDSDSMSSALSLSTLYCLQEKINNLTSLLRSPEVNFWRNVITQEPLGLESPFYNQLMRNSHVSICCKRTLIFVVNLMIFKLF